MINKERIPCPQEEKRCCSYKTSKRWMDWHRKPSLFFRNPVHIRHMHVLCILDYIHTRSWRTDCLTCAMISQPPSTTTTSTISPSTSTITTSTPTDQPTSPAYYYFYCFYCYYNSYWAPIGLPSPRSHRPSFLLSSHYIVPCTSYRWSITSCHHCIVSSSYITTYPCLSPLGLKIVHLIAISHTLGRDACVQIGRDKDRDKDKWYIS